MHAFVKELTTAAGRDNGVLANHHLTRVLDEGFVFADDGDGLRANVQPASIDLRLGDVAYRLKCSFLPGKATVEQRVSELIAEEIALGNGAVLHQNISYLIPLQERLRLPDGVRARANPKSSTGRADVLTRVVTDKSFLFDDVRDGYEGVLYIEVVPLSFNVRVQRGLTLNQLRLSIGETRLNDRQLHAFHGEQRPLLYRRGGVVNDADFNVSNGLFLGLNLEGDKQGLVGYRSNTAAVPDLDLTVVGETDPAPYWEPVYQDRKRITLEPKRFYLLMSDEAVSIPPELAAEMTAYDPTSGELRTHYAGFFDPGFGYGPHQPAGSTAALEVRAHDIKFQVEHRQRVCKLTYEWMLEVPDVLYGTAIGSNYQGQTSTLGKHFRVPKPRTKTPATAPTEPDQLPFPVHGDDAEPARR